MSIFCITDDKKSFVWKSSTNMYLSSSFLEYCVSIISLSGPSPHTLVLVAIVSLFQRAEPIISDTPNIAFLILLYLSRLLTETVLISTVIFVLKKS